MLNSDVQELSDAIENMYEEQETEFEWTKSFYDLQKTCPIHEVGAKDLELQRYVCPNCNRILKKIPKFAEWE